MVLAAMLAAGPALAVSTPEGLVEELNMAAHAGKEAAFLSALSAGTRRAITQVNAAQSRLSLAERDFYAALKDRFGTAQVRGGTPVARTGLSGLVGVDLVSVERRTPHAALLRLRTVTSGIREHTITKEYAFPAVVENGQWKLDLAAAELGVLHTYRRWQAAYERITQQIRAGAFSNQVAATVALVNARRRSG